MPFMLCWVPVVSNMVWKYWLVLMFYSIIRKREIPVLCWMPVSFVGFVKHLLLVKQLQRIKAVANEIYCMYIDNERK